MEIDKIKQYVNTYLVEHGLHLEKMYTDDHYLNTATKRYQFFGDKMFSTHAQFLCRVYLSPHQWFLLDMVAPSISWTDNIPCIFSHALQNPNKEMWRRAYAYYDEIGHDKLISMSLGSYTEEYVAVKDLLDQYRDEIFGSYDII